MFNILPPDLPQPETMTEIILSFLHVVRAAEVLVRTERPQHRTQAIHSPHSSLPLTYCITAAPST